GEFVQLLPADIGDGVLRDVGGGQDEWLDVANIVLVLLRHVDAVESFCRSESHSFKALSVGSKDNFAGHTIFALGTPVVVNFLDGESLSVSVVVAFQLE